MLTQKQKALLAFIHERLSTSGISPSFEEMKEALGLKSKSGIDRLIGALEERGFLKRLANRARALEVVKLPDGMEFREVTPAAATSKPVDEGAQTNVVSASFGRPQASNNTITQPQSTNNAMVTLALHGKIAAGTPIEALEQIDSYIDVPRSMADENGCYALSVSGDSMIDKGILDGDTVIIRNTQTARDGEIVVALVDGEEATLKTLRMDGPNVLLIPANVDHQPQQYSANRVQVQGKLIGLVRNYH